MFEQKDAQREADEGDQSRDLNRQTYVACAQHRPECDRKYHDRQQNEDQHRPNRRDMTASAPHDQRENRAGNRADRKLTGDCRSNAKLL